jgi:hypothetical protein
MRQDEIISMSRQAGFIDADWNMWMVLPHLDAFAKLVAQHEREACAKLCDEARAARLAEQIRARGQE